MISSAGVAASPAKSATFSGRMLASFAVPVQDFTISAPTSLAIDRAREAGVRLVVLARPDSMLVVA